MGSACPPPSFLFFWILPLSICNGFLGVAFNLTVLKCNAARRAFHHRFGFSKTSTSHASKRSKALCCLAEILVLSLLTSLTNVFTLEAFSCRNQRFGDMYLGDSIDGCTCNADAKSQACSGTWDQCGGLLWHGSQCCQQDDGYGAVECVVQSALFSQCVPSTYAEEISSISSSCMPPSLRDQIVLNTQHILHHLPRATCTLYMHSVHALKTCLLTLCRSIGISRMALKGKSYAIVAAYKRQYQDRMFPC